MQPSPTRQHSVPPEPYGHRDTYIAALSVFAARGFRKTSMVALAEAIDVSRQTLYNRFKSKDEVLNWGIRGLIESLRADALSHLKHGSGDVQTVLLEVFCSWLGPMVGLLRSGSHGQEFLGLGANTHNSDSADHFSAFTTDIADFLIHKGICTTKREAQERTFLLAMAGKGLLLISPSETQFRTDMATAIRGAKLQSTNQTATRQNR